MKPRELTDIRDIVNRDPGARDLPAYRGSEFSVDGIEAVGCDGGHIREWVGAGLLLTLGSLNNRSARRRIARQRDDVIAALALRIVRRPADT
jgi:hypothetical protein